MAATGGNEHFSTRFRQHDSGQQAGPPAFCGATMVTPAARSKRDPSRIDPAPPRSRRIVPDANRARMDPQIAPSSRCLSDLPALTSVRERHDRTIAAGSTPHSRLSSAVQNAAMQQTRSREGHCRVTDDQTRTLDLQPGGTVVIRGRSFVVESLRRGRNGDVQIQATRRSGRWSETVLWPAEAIEGRAPRRRE